MTQTPTPVTADFCSFDEYKKIEGTKRTIGFCNNDVTALPIFQTVDMSKSKKPVYTHS